MGEITKQKQKNELTDINLALTPCLFDLRAFYSAPRVSSELAEVVTTRTGWTYQN